MSWCLDIKAKYISQYARCMGTRPSTLVLMEGSTNGDHKVRAKGSLTGVNPADQGSLLCILYGSDA